jgi:dihydroorotase
MTAVTPTIPQGGVDCVFVMPNLIPPITTIPQAQSYHSSLLALSHTTTFLMSLYLCPAITPTTIKQAKESGIIYGVKSYPAGVTTNSAQGVLDYAAYYDVFAAMEREGLVLNLHGEVPSSEAEGVDVLNAEERFLPTLKDLSARFPRLRIVLEHCTTAAAVEAVMELGENVVGTITAHHLFLTVEDWAGDPVNFCKPVAKRYADRRALLRAVVEGKGKFFLGTDSAPHLLGSKYGGIGAGGGNDNAVVLPGKCAAGVFTQPYATQLVLEAVDGAIESGVIAEEEVGTDVLEGFLGRYGRKFYQVEESKRRIRIVDGEEKVMETLGVKKAMGNDELEDVVVPFRRKERVYSLEWLSD